MLKFLHCADLHLDSPFKGLEKKDADLAEEAVNSTFRAFSNLVKTAIDENVDFVIIAGDVFDSKDKSLRAILQFRQGLKKLAQAGIASFIVHGNHDPQSAWAEDFKFPEPVHFFPVNSVQSIPFKEDGKVLATISGISFGKASVTKNLAKEFRKLKADGFHIAVLHANVGGQPGHDNYAPCTLADLEKSSVDYWALGHVHNRQILKDESPWVVYPGNIQGRHINESGEKGCYLVQVDESGNTDLRFIPLQEIIWERLTLDCGGFETTDALLDGILQRMESLPLPAEGSRCFIRFELTGQTKLFTNFQDTEFKEAIGQELREALEAQYPECNVVSIRFNVQPHISLEQIKEEDSFRSDVYEAYLSSCTAEQILQIISRDKSFKLYRRLVENTTSEELEKLAEDALKRIMDAISEYNT